MPFRRKLLILAAATGIFFLLVIAAGSALFFSPLLTRYDGAASSCEPFKLIVPAENIEFTLETPLFSVRDVAVSNRIVHYILPLLGV